MRGSLPFAEPFHALAVPSDKHNFAPNASGSESASVVTEAKGKKNEYGKLPPPTPIPGRVRMFHFCSQWETFLNPKGEDVNLFFWAILSLRLIRAACVKWAAAPQLLPSPTFPPPSEVVTMELRARGENCFLKHTLAFPLLSSTKPVY